MFEVLRKHAVTMKFVCLGFHLSSQEAYEPLIDPEGLSWQVILFSYILNLQENNSSDKFCSYFHEGSHDAYLESLHNLFRSTWTKDVFTYLL